MDLDSSAGNAEKATACQNQLRMWDALLEVRIRMQRMLIEANKLPQLDMLNKAVNGTSSAEKCRFALRDLLTKLINFQELLVSQNPEVSKSLGKKRKAEDNEEEDEEIPSDEEITSSEDEKEPEDEENNLDLSEDIVEKSDTSFSNAKKTDKPKIKKMKIEELESNIQSQFKSLIPYRNETIQKWNEKTQVSFGKYGKKTHEISTLKQIDHILSNKEKLLKRTRVKRSAYQTIGKQQQPEDVDNESDHEIFDDDDFYHQLLRELIERKTSNVSDPVQLSRHWLELQKMRSKLKKKVDTKASKGRKIRYDGFTKLVNFMAPEDNCPMSENAVKELISSLFGKLL